MTDPGPPDDIVTELLSREGGDNVIAIVGYLGEGPEGFRRFFQDEELRIWIDIPTDEIVYSRRLTEEEDSLGGRTVLWIKRPALELPISPDLVGSFASQFMIGEFAAQEILPDSLEDVLYDLTFLVVSNKYHPCR